MRKLLVTCECGQQMQVPRSALGKMGMCPTCGQTTRISSENTSALPPRGRKKKANDAGAARSKRKPPLSGGPSASQGDAKQRFGQAVDHYYAGRYGQALAVFDGLAKDFPDDLEIGRGREQCLAAIRGAKVTRALPAGGPARLPGESKLDEETVRRVVLEKLVGGSSDEVQLKAAEIASKLLGLGSFGGSAPSVLADSATLTTESANAEGERAAAESPGLSQGQSNGNGHDAVGDTEASSEAEDSKVEDT